MPTYEYECTKCSHAFERFQQMSEKPVERCPKCRSKVKRLLGTGAGIIFKGSGFYETDYKRKPSPSDGEGSSGASKGKPKSEVAAAPASSPAPAAKPSTKKDSK